jgi:Nuclear transport factor 2 (NTF2) domain
MLKPADIPDCEQLTSIDGIDEGVISEYFLRLNQGDFSAAANLFSVDGSLNPPFEKPIQGRDAIAQYLDQEAKGMKCCPKQGEKLSSDGEHTQYRVEGQVETYWFTVHVVWLMQLSATKQIVTVDVNLLTSLAELAGFARS